MDDSHIRSKFYIDDHAVLYALLVKNAADEFGDRGNAAAEKATILYGRERGLRMAMRCVADGNPLTADNYMVYGEWLDDRGWSEFRVGGYEPYELDAVVCGWNDAWVKYGLLDYGKKYCQFIDVELVRGFNPDNDFALQGTLSQGSEKCQFLFGGISATSDANSKHIGELRKKKIPYVVKDFLYHTAHVLSAFQRTYFLEFGLLKTQDVLKKTFSDYTKIFGAEKLRALQNEAALDFLTISA
jgi:hypothetical protein